MSIISEEASVSGDRLKGLTQEKLELEGTRDELVQRIDTLRILIQAEEAKLKVLESQSRQMNEPSFEMPDQVPRLRYT